MLGLGNSLANMLVPQGVTYDNGYSIYTDGTNDSFTTGATFQSTFRGSFTVGWWIKMGTVSTSANENIWGNFDVTGTASMVHFATTTSGALLLTFGAEGQYLTCQTAAGTFSTTEGAAGGTGGNWKHVAVVVTHVGGGSDTTGKIYVNGSDATSAVSNGVTGTEQEALDLGAVPLQFGALGVSTIQLYHIPATLDEIGIWDAALDADAISAVYNSGSPFDLGSDNGDYDNSGDLVSYYKFTEGTGTSVADSAGSNTGTLVNGTAWKTDTP